MVTGKLGDLSGIPESGLLDIVRLILSKPGGITGKDRAELDRINEEMVRREPGLRNDRRRETYKVRRLRERMQQVVKEARARQKVIAKLKDGHLPG